MLRGYSSQTAGNLGEAERLYRAALSLNSNNFDALHMLGVICLQKGDAEEAVRLLMAAFPMLPAEYPAFFRNLGLCLGAVAKKRKLVGAAAEDEPGDAYLDFSREGSLAALPDRPPRVSVVMPCFNCRQHADEAIKSIAEQNYSNVELIVVDDGSQDDSVETISRALSHVHFSSQVARRDHRGIHAALNEGIAMARGRFIGVLGAADRFAAGRIEKMVRMLVGHGARWGVSNVGFIDQASRQIVYGERPSVDTIMRSYDSFYASHAVSENFPDHDDALTTGNLFFERTLWQDIGGFPPYRHYPGWAFSLSAILLAEPAYLDEPAYLYRIPHDGVLDATRHACERERAVIRTRWEHHLKSLREVPNLIFVDASDKRRKREMSLMASGVGHLLDRRRMLSYAAEMGFGRVLQG